MVLKKREIPISRREMNVQEGDGVIKRESMMILNPVPLVKLDIVHVMNTGVGYDCKDTF